MRLTLRQIVIPDCSRQPVDASIEPSGWIAVTESRELVDGYYTLCRAKQARQTAVDAFVIPISLDRLYGYGRLSLPPEERVELALKIMPSIAEQAQQRANTGRSNGGKAKNAQDYAPVLSARTDEIAAGILNTNRTTLRNELSLYQARNDHPDLWDNYLSSVKTDRRPAKHAKRLAKRLRIAEALKTQAGVELPTRVSTNTMVRGDCLEVMRTMPSCSVHGSIFSPPFGDGMKYDGWVDTAKGPDEWWDWFQPFNQEIERLVVAGGPIAIGLPTRLLLAVGQRLGSEVYTICKESVPLAKTAPIGPATEFFVVRWKPGAPRLVPAIPLCSRNFYVAPYRPFDGLELPHPCPLPVSAATTLVGTLLIEKGTLLEPFAGIGNLLLGAHFTGRKWIGIEQSERYCQEFYRRLKTEKPWLESSEQSSRCAKTLDKVKKYWRATFNGLRKSEAECKLMESEIVEMKQQVADRGGLSTGSRSGRNGR